MLGGKSDSGLTPCGTGGPPAWSPRARPLPRGQLVEASAFGLESGLTPVAGPDLRGPVVSQGDLVSVIGLAPYLPGIRSKAGPNRICPVFGLTMRST
jgi:hypothetical protein